MKILFIAPYVPSRIRIRPFQLTKELSKRHSVHVLALSEVGSAKGRGSEELADIAEQFRVVPHSKLRGLSQSLLALPTPNPMCAAYCWSPAMRRAIAEELSSTKFDIVHIEHLRAAHFAKSCGGLPVVFDSVDCLTGLFGQMYRSKKNPLGKLVMLEETLKLRRYEPRTLARFQRVIITSESERDELMSLDPTLRIDVLPNGVDTDYFAPMGLPKAGNRIVFTGKMGYHPNAQAAIWFAENVFPAVRSKHPDAQFVIVGSDPPAEVVKLREQPGITVTGYVDDIRPHIDSASVAVVPMRIAVGVQNKVLEAMAMGLPVVATPIATRALSADCPGVIEAAGAEDMIAEVSKLLDNPDLARRTGEQGRQEVIRNFSWDSNVGKLELIYEEAVRDFTR
jgi:sugar transferase (PEP-CTERM/EpsH1 system associated)